MLSFILRVLFSQRGTASASKSEQYQNYEVLGRAFDGAYARGRLIGVAHTYIVGTGTYTTGTTDTVSGVVKLFTHKAGWKLFGGTVVTNGLSASAGVGQTPVIGDGTTANLYMLATDFDVAAVGTMASTAIGYTPTSDVIVTLTFGATGIPVAGQYIKTHMLFMAP